jgi:retron-type reverse transcriptase
MKIITFISTTLCIEEKEIKDFINSSPYRYKVYQIQKRHGNGTRTIAQPTQELKALQKMVLEKFFSFLPVHECAKAYCKNINIKDNALAHVENQYLLKMDFRDFFPSITSDAFIAHIEKNGIELSVGDKISVKKLFFWTKKRNIVHRLSIGAPSSPFISNTIMYEFDSIIYNITSKMGITYTRYADDLTFTTNTKNILFDIPDVIEKICEKLEYPKLKINHEKTVFSSKKNNRHITGLVINNQDEISLGRDRKREIKSLIFKYSKHELSAEDTLRLSGILSFAKHIEPTFYESLIRKYSIEIIRELETSKKTKE